MVTTGGGFYRYQLHDLVEVVDHMEQAPCLQFLGKTDQVSDWFGEKPNEHFVAETLDKIFHKHGRISCGLALHLDFRDEDKACVDQVRVMFRRRLSRDLVRITMQACE